MGLGTTGLRVKVRITQAPQSNNPTFRGRFSRQIFMMCTLQTYRYTTLF